jgi:hypothetical protein
MQPWPIIRFLKHQIQFIVLSRIITFTRVHDGGERDMLTVQMLTSVGVLFLCLAASLN